MKFTIYGNPVSKGRPRFARHGKFIKTYTDEKTVSYENLVKLSFLEQIEDKMKYLTEDKKELKAVITAYYSIPKSTSNKKREFDPEEVDWENDEEEKWHIYKSLGYWHTIYTCGVKQNLQVYFTTKEKAEQCLKWLKKQGVLY